MGLTFRFLPKGETTASINILSKASKAKDESLREEASKRLRFESVMFLLPLGMILASWEIVLKLNLISTSTLPPPSSIFTILAINVITNPLFTVGVFRSLLNISIGIFFAMVTAVPLAIVVGLKSRVDYSITPLIMIFGALPDIALLPFLTYWFGPGLTAAILLSTLVAFFPIFFTVREGVRNIPRDYFYVAAIYKARRLNMYTKLILPAVFPQLITGIRLAYEFLWEIVLAIEIIAHIAGIGSIINLAVEEGSLTYALAGIFMIGAIAIIIDRLIFAHFEDRIRRWHE